MAAESGQVIGFLLKGGLKRTILVHLHHFSWGVKVERWKSLEGLSALSLELSRHGWCRMNDL
jgi:hypothetical protein